MQNTVRVPTELLEQMYTYLVLYGLLHGIGENENYNTLLKKVEKILPDESLIIK